MTETEMNTLSHCAPVQPTPGTRQNNSHCSSTNSTPTSSYHNDHSEKDSNYSMRSSTQLNDSNKLNNLSTSLSNILDQLEIICENASKPSTPSVSLFSPSSSSSSFPSSSSISSCFISQLSRPASMTSSLTSGYDSLLSASSSSSCSSDTSLSNIIENLNKQAILENSLLETSRKNPFSIDSKLKENEEYYTDRVSKTYDSMIHKGSFSIPCFLLPPLSCIPSPSSSTTSSSLLSPRPLSPSSSSPHFPLSSFSPAFKSLKSAFNFSPSLTSISEICSKNQKYNNNLINSYFVNSSGTYSKENTLKKTDLQTLKDELKQQIFPEVFVEPQETIHIKKSYQSKNLTSNLTTLNQSSNSNLYTENKNNACEIDLENKQSVNDCYYNNHTLGRHYKTNICSNEYYQNSCAENNGFKGNEVTENIWKTNRNSGIDKTFNGKDFNNNMEGYSDQFANNEKSIRERNKQLTYAKNIFNLNSKKGIQYMLDKGLLEPSAEHIADFLFNSKGLSKTSIGEYLGEKADLNIQVLSFFTKKHQLRDRSFVQAMRGYLASFRLPGEAQKIDRVVEVFAREYCFQNPAVFVDTDTCYTVSFALIMLNTSLHNRNVKRKVTLNEFICMNKKTNRNVSTQLLTDLYKSIKKEQLRLPSDDKHFINSEKEGWLSKKGKKGWRRRWCVLNEGCLFYFNKPQDKQPKGIIPLQYLKVETSNNIFQLYSVLGNVIKACRRDSDKKLVKAHHFSYKFACISDTECQEWVQHIRHNIQDHSLRPNDSLSSFYGTNSNVDHQSSSPHSLENKHYVNNENKKIGSNNDTSSNNKRNNNNSNKKSNNHNNNNNTNSDNINSDDDKRKKYTLYKRTLSQLNKKFVFGTLPRKLSVQ